MNTFDIILQQVGLFVIYILAGLLLVKTKVLNRETLEPISKFVIKMALPLMVFINITDGTDKKNLYESWPILVIAVGFYICIYAAGAMAVKFFKQQESRVGIYRAMLLFGNIGFIGLPMISSVFPENGILYASVFMLIDQFMLWTLGVKLTSPTGEGGFKLKKNDQPCNSGNCARNSTEVYGDKDSDSSGYCLFKNRIYRISTCNDLCRRNFCRNFIKKISQGNFSVWNCIA